jgi:hypothetical protein
MPTLTLAPTADARVESGGPTTNYGTAQFLMARYGTHRTYVAFNTAGVPAAETITAATLRLPITCCANSPGVKVYKLTPTGTWAEGTITWANQPPNLERPEVGQTVTADAGAWSGTPTPTLSYQWKLNNAEIPGATSLSYVVQAGDVAQSLKCTVTATNTAGSVSADTNSVIPE